MENSNGKCVLDPQYGKDESKQLHFYCENCDREMYIGEVRDCPALVNISSTDTQETKCEHDFPRAIRKGRASYECPTCHEDISMAWFYWMDAIKN